MYDFVPISPLRTKSGALVSLIEHLGEKDSMPVALGDKATALSNFQVVSDAMSISAAATLGVGSIFRGALSGNERAFFFDAMAYADRYEEQRLPDQKVIGTRWGVGIRVLLRVALLEANATVNFGLVGAAVELGRARARYEIIGIGIGIDGLVAVLEELPSIGDFKYETYLKLNGNVVKKLAKLISTKKDELVPEPVAVALTRPIDPISHARSIYYAVAAIGDRRPLNDALHGRPVTLDADAIRNVYAYFGVPDGSAKPSEDAERQADKWLRR